MILFIAITNIIQIHFTKTFRKLKLISGFKTRTFCKQKNTNIKTINYCHKQMYIKTSYLLLNIHLFLIRNKI